MKQMITICYEYKIPAVILFIYFKKVYDSDKQIQIQQIMEEFNITPKLITLLYMTIRELKVTARINQDSVICSVFKKRTKSQLC